MYGHWNHGSLDDFMEFDRVVAVHADGKTVEHSHAVYAPELDGEEILSSLPWTFVNGFSGQYGYGGPVMHPSEYIGGRLEKHILENPGFYTVVAVYPTFEEREAALDDTGLSDDPYGWAVLFLDFDDAE